MTLRGRKAALSAACGVLFVTFLDTTVVSVTLGSVQSDLHASVVALQWVVNAYALVFASLMLTAGSLGDRFGRRRIMLAGLFVFSGGSVLAALAPSVGVLITARAIMGVGAAASEPGTLSLLRQVFPERRSRARALGTWAAVSGLALAAGPVVGGVLIGIGDWRTVFWFNLVIGLVAFGAAVRYLPESADPRPGRLDIAGFLLGATVLGCGVFAVIAGENAGYSAPWIVLLFVLCGLGMIVFVRVESARDEPMLQLRYLRKPNISGALFVAFAVYFGVFSIFFFTALYLQEVVGYSGWRTAAEFAPMTGAIIVGSLLAGRWVAHVGTRTPMITGCLLGGVGLLLTEHYINVHPQFAALAISLALAGLGFGIAVVPLTSAVMSAVPAEHSGMAASATNTSRQLGAVVGVAVLGSLVNSHLTSGLRGRLADLGVPGNFQSIIINAIEQGSVPSGGDAAATAQYGNIVQRVIGATYQAFHDGLTAALILSAALMFLAALVTIATNRRTGRPSRFARRRTREVSAQSR